MTLKEGHIVSGLLRKGQSVYVLYEENDVVVHFKYEGKELMCYPKGKGRKPKGFKFTENPDMQDALELGELITKEDYERF